MTVQVLELQYSIGGRPDGKAIEKLIVAFERAGHELRDFGKYLWPKLTPVLEQAIGRQFDAEGEGPTGKWAPLSMQYQVWKRANYPGRTILKRTGVLYDALTNSGSPFALRQAMGDTYSFGTRGVVYASHHQDGTRRMPARPMFDFGSSFETELQSAALAAVREALQQARVDQVADLSDLHAA